MTEELATIADRLQDAEYLHVLLETLPIYGSFGGTALLLFAVMLKNQPFRLIALSIMLLSALSFYPHLHNRKLAQAHMLAVKTPGEGQQITTQTRLRASSHWAYLALAASCILTLSIRRGRVGKALLAVTVAGAMAVCLLSVRLHIRDAEILYPNINLGPGTEAEVVPPGLPGLPGTQP